MRIPSRKAAFEQADRQAQGLKINRCAGRNARLVSDQRHWTRFPLQRLRQHLTGREQTLQGFAHQRKLLGQVGDAVVFATGAAAAPMTAFAAACKERGLWPFTHFNRTHVAPPCTTTAEDAREGLALLDEALDTADQFTS